MQALRSQERVGDANFRLSAGFLEVMILGFRMCILCPSRRGGGRSSELNPVLARSRDQKPQLTEICKPSSPRAPPNLCKQCLSVARAWNEVIQKLRHLLCLFLGCLRQPTTSTASTTSTTSASIGGLCLVLSFLLRILLALRCAFVGRLSSGSGFGPSLVLAPAELPVVAVKNALILTVLL